MWPPTLLCLVFLSMFTPMPSLFSCNSQTFQPSFPKPFPFQSLYPPCPVSCVPFVLTSVSTNMQYSVSILPFLLMIFFSEPLSVSYVLIVDCVCISGSVLKKCRICLIWSKFPVRMSWRNQSIWNTDGYLRPPCWESCYSKSFSDCG